MNTTIIVALIITFVVGFYFGFGIAETMSSSNKRTPYHIRYLEQTHHQHLPKSVPIIGPAGRKSDRMDAEIFREAMSYGEDTQTY